MASYDEWPFNNGANDVENCESDDEYVHWWAQRPVLVEDTEKEAVGGKTNCE